MQIKNKVFIVTGGASGLGLATATMIVENGGFALIADVNTKPDAPPVTMNTLFLICISLNC